MNLDDELKLRPRRNDSPELSNWGVFGDADELGCLNYLTPSVVRRAATTVREGVAYPLNLPANLPTNRPLFRPEFVRTAHVYNVSYNGVITNDDHVVLATQGSSQWDAFVHCGTGADGANGVFYNGIKPEDIDATGYAHRGGIDKVAQRGIAGRGVLIDIARMVAGGREDPLPLDFEIDENVYAACLRSQRVEVLPGDIPCFRTGWTERYLDGDAAERAALMAPADANGAPLNPGISTRLAPIAQQQRWAAVTADNLAVEVAPFRPDNIRSAHITMQRNLGIPFGELFVFRELARACASERRFEFLFVAVPLWIPGGVGSPANAMAIR